MERPSLTTRNTEPSALTPPSREALIEGLIAELRRFEDLSLPLVKLHKESLLWFHPHEFSEVNRVWSENGVEGIHARWGSSRTFDSGLPVTFARQPKDHSPEAPEHPEILMISEFAPDRSPDPAQLNYFRSSSFELTQSDQSKVLSSLVDVGLLSKVVPHEDSITKIPLRGAPVSEVSCRSEWYGPENIYGDGPALILSLTFAPTGHESLQVKLNIDSSGTLRRSLWYENYFETGYEGHAYEAFTLTSQELRALVPLLAHISELPHHHSQNLINGIWLGNSFPLR